jgi:hypothetical protein
VKSKKTNKIIVKIFLVLVVPLILTVVFYETKRDSFEFVDQGVQRMVAPAEPLPYISSLFGDLLYGVGFSWHYFCIQNNSVITGYSLPEDLDYKVGDAASFTKIRYGDTACVPIRNKDIFYDVAWGGFQINDKSIAAKLFKCDGRNCVAKFDIRRSINFSVYSKLTLAASSLVYLLFVAAIYGIIELITSIYKYVVRE